MDDSNDIDVNNHNEQSPSHFRDNPFISRQHDSANDPQLEDSDGSDPGELDEHEQQDAALQAEWLCSRYLLSSAQSART